MSSSRFFVVISLLFFAISCGDSIDTKNKTKTDNDSNVSSDDDTVNDNSTGDDQINDDFVNDDFVNDDFVNDDLIDEVTVDENSKIPDDDISEQNECVNGTRQCYGAYQYQVCDDFDEDGYTEWGEALTCSNSGTCSGSGICSNDCYSHNYYQCSGGHVYWYDSCGTKEDLKESCGVSGYTGSKYCDYDDVYQNYSTKSCSSDYCDESTAPVFVESCTAGCTSGSCNAAEDISWYDSTSELTWQNSKFSAALSLSSASSYCSSLTFDGYSDWRLPTISELRSLIRGCSNAETEGSCKVTDYCSSWETCTASCFSCTSGNGPSGDNNYWDSNLDGGETSLLSATPVPGYSGYNWYIDFTTAEISYSFDTAATNFRCVRGTMPGDTLTAPTNVTASDGDFDNYIIISWDKVPGATNYNIYRSTSPLSGYSHLQNLGVTDYSIDYPPHASITYYYKISAYNSTYGESELSSYNSGSCY